MRSHEIVLAFVEIKGHKTCVAGQASAVASGSDEGAVIFGVVPPYTRDRLPPRGVSKLGLPPSIKVDLARIERDRLFPTLRTGLTLAQWQQTPSTGIHEMMHEVAERRPFFAAPCNELLCFSIAFRLAESGLMMPNLFSATLFPEKDDFTSDTDQEVDALIDESVSRVLAAVSRIKHLNKTHPVQS